MRVEVILLVYWCGMDGMLLGAAVMTLVAVIECFE